MILSFGRPSSQPLVWGNQPCAWEKELHLVVMDGTCKGAFPLIRGKYPHIQCFTCPTHDIYGFIKNICDSKEEIQMQHNEMGDVGVQYVEWDADLIEEAFTQV